MWQHFISKVNFSIILFYKWITRFSIDLVLWNNNLSWQSILGVGNSMVKNAYSSDHLSDLLDTICHIWWIADNKLTFGCLLARFDANNFAALHHNLIDWLVQHVHTTVDGGQAREPLRELAETIQWIQVRGNTVSHQGLGVELYSFDCVNGRLLEITKSKTTTN